MASQEDACWRCDAAWTESPGGPAAAPVLDGTAPAAREGIPGALISIPRADEETLARA
jgi:hypothetical protein